MLLHIIQQWQLQLIAIIRLILSCVCGFLIGCERQERLRQQHIQSAGLRTHMLVALAAAALMLISKYGFMDVLSYGDNVRVDVSRVAAGIVSGVGFIGAGIIFVRKDNIMGLTTAAGLMATAAVGMAVGSGMYVCGVALTVLIVFIQEMNRLALYQRAENQIVIIEWKEKAGMTEFLLDWLKQHHVQITHVEIRRLQGERMQMRLDVEVGNKQTEEPFLQLQEEVEEVTRIDF